MKPLTIILLTLALAVPATWFATKHFPASSAATSTGGKRKILYYQSAMHPWVKSNKPGRCTICGMELTPVYEGQKGFEETGDMLTLTQSMVQVLHVQTVEAKRRPLAKTLTFAGIVDDDSHRHRIISAYVDGRVDRLFSNHHGAEVVEGKPLAEIYSPTLLQSEREYRSVSGELRQNVALRLRQMGLRPKQIAALLTKSPDALTTEILSPVSGTVVNDEIFAGQYVTAGQKLFEIADFSTMWFVFRAYEQDIPWLKIGQAVEVRTPAVPGRVFSGTIGFIDPNFDPVTRATEVRVELPNPLVEGSRALLHRIYGDGVVHLAAPEVLTVPRSAVIQTGPEAVVYVEHEGGTYARQAVQLGRRGDEFVEILAGLSERDMVVTNGNLLIDGQAEMNRSFSQSPKVMPALTDAQRKAVESFAETADAIADALSKDDLPAFNKTSPEALLATETLASALAVRLDLADALKNLSTVSHFHTAAGLNTARQEFLAFSTSAVGLLEPLRKGGRPVEVEVFECPMVNKAVPDAPKKGRWLQKAGTTVRNPYFGAEMLDCGVKVNP